MSVSALWKKKRGNRIYKNGEILCIVGIFELGDGNYMVLYMVGIGLFYFFILFMKRLGIIILYAPF